jgi:membrane associated rhomboid family serine protease
LTCARQASHRRDAAGAQIWLGLALALAAPSACLEWVPLDQPAQTWPALAQALALHPDAGWHQAPWVWWTTAWLHGSPSHLHHNLVAATLLAIAGALSRLPPAMALAAWMAWPLTHAGMLVGAPLHTYIGLSGVLHAQAAIVALHWLTAPAEHLPGHLPSHLFFSKIPKISGLLLGSGLIFKILMENPWQHPLIQSAGSDITVAPWAHLSGTAAGIALGLFTSVTARFADVKGLTRKPRTLD